ncbi:MAG: SOS response-associated peptidase [Verrucomicrobiota bacterium]
MCGRLVITANGQVIADAFDLDAILEVPARYNIFPGEPILAIRRGLRSLDDSLEANWFNWGLVPNWADSPNIAFKTINARSETVRSLPTFRDAYKYRRCVIPATGFYEWKDTGTGPPIPHFIGRSDNRLILMAGLWEHWMNADGSEIESATILTCDSSQNSDIQKIHSRMPVMLEPEQISTWLNKKAPDSRHYASVVNRTIRASFDIWPVSEAVNRAGSDHPQLMKRVSILEQGELF